MTRVSIIIPHFNQPDLLRLCLNSVLGQSFPLGDCEIIVADNATPGGIDDVIEEYPNVIFISEVERGAAAARNAALKYAKGQIIAFIDSDCVADQNWLTHAISSLEAGLADMIGGAVRVTCANPKQRTAEEIFEQLFAFRQKTYINKKGFSVTANLIVNKSVTDAVGEFRNGVSEDVDWCHRARALGFRLVFDGKAIISHPARADWPSLQAKWLRLTRETYLLEQQAGISAIRWQLKAVVVGLSAIVHSFYVTAHPLAGGPMMRMKVVGVLVRQRVWRMRKMLEVLREAKRGSVAPGWQRAEIAFRDDR